MYILKKTNKAIYTRTLVMASSNQVIERYTEDETPRFQIELNRRNLD